MLEYVALPVVIRPQVESKGLSGPAKRASVGAGLAATSVVSMALFGSAALMGDSRGEDAPGRDAVAARPFETREEAPVRPDAGLLTLETRPSSPLPFAGGALGPEPAPPPPAEWRDEPETRVALPEEAPARAVRPRERHVLTSFDGGRELTDGPSAPEQAGRFVKLAFAPPPVVWNNPLQWISVH